MPLILAVALQAAALATTPLATTPRAEGYLGPAGVPNAVAILPAPPAKGSADEARDVAAYHATRSLEGSPRWAMAADDSRSGPAALLAHFDCALGVRLEAQATPALLRLFTRTGRDASAIVTAAKTHYARPRPFIVDPLSICVPRRSAEDSASYPSGHSTAGWAAGLVLAEIAPDRATQVLTRARAFGDSRVVCGVHYVSDVEAGRTTGAALIAAEHANPDFRADLEDAKAELAVLRRSQSAPTPYASCAAETRQFAATPW